MARALIVHPALDSYGGGELVALAIARALSNMGFKVSIATSRRVDERVLEEILGFKINGVELTYTGPLAKRLQWPARVLSMEGKFRKIRAIIAFWVFYTTAKHVLRDYDLTVDTQSNLLPPVDVVYIHYPTIAPALNRSVPRIIYDRLAKIIAEISTSKPRAVLTNSTWTAVKVYQAYKLKPIVVYPPVRVGDFAKYASNDKREKTIVTVSRIDYRKRVDRVLDAAERLRDYTFIIAGSLGWYSPRALRIMREKIEAYKLDNIILKPMLPRSDLAKLLGEARFYLHPELPEHFGISIVEAMSAGAVPIVYKDGGAWTDIVSRISPILGYRRIEEAAGIIRAIDGKPGLLSELREKSARLSWMFNYDRFEREVQAIAKRIVESKKR